MLCVTKGQVQPDFWSFFIIRQRGKRVWGSNVLSFETEVVAPMFNRLIKGARDEARIHRGVEYHVGVRWKCRTWQLHWTKENKSSVAPRLLVAKDAWQHGWTANGERAGSGIGKGVVTGRVAHPLPLCSLESLPSAPAKCKHV